MNWLQTFSGRCFDIDNPTNIDIIDIAHALGNQCRYAGHTSKFYSVAEHSIWVSHHVSEENKLAALLHDASEAYLVDVPRPIKPYLKGYYELEAKIQGAIYEHFGLLREIPEEVKVADTRILYDERKYLLKKPPRDWQEEGTEPLGITIRAFPPHQVKHYFLKRFGELVRKTVAA